VPHRGRRAICVGIPGHGCLCLVDAFLRYRDDLQVIQVRQEMAAVHLADGYFRVTGQPLAVFASIARATVNTAIGLANLLRGLHGGACPLGDVHSYMTGKGVLQELDRFRRNRRNPVPSAVHQGILAPGSAAELPGVNAERVEDYASRQAGAGPDLTGHGYSGRGRGCQDPGIRRGQARREVRRGDDSSRRKPCWPPPRGR